MKNTIISFLLLCNFFHGVNAQTVDYRPYFMKIDSADYFASIKDYAKSLQYYLAAFKIQKPIGQDYFSIAEVYLKMGKIKKALRCFKKAAISGYNESRFEDVLNDSLYKNADTRAFLEKLPKYRAQFYKNLDINTYIRLKEIGAEDNLVRSNMEWFKNPLLLNEAKAVDSLHLDWLIKYVEKNGWISFNKFGDASEIAYLLLLHTNSEHTVLNSIVRKAIIKGEIRPFQYAYWIDYHKLPEKKQVYGMIYYDKWKKIPYENFESIDETRKNVGLNPLRFEFVKNGKEYPFK